MSIKHIVECNAAVYFWANSYLVRRIGKKGSSFKKIGIAVHVPMCLSFPSWRFQLYLLWCIVRFFLVLSSRAKRLWGLQKTLFQVDQADLLGGGHAFLMVTQAKPSGLVVVQWLVLSLVSWPLAGAGGAFCTVFDLQVVGVWVCLGNMEPLNGLLGWHVHGWRFNIHWRLIAWASFIWLRW